MEYKSFLIVRDGNSTWLAFFWPYVNTIVIVNIKGKLQLRWLKLVLKSKVNADRQQKTGRYF